MAGPLLPQQKPRDIYNLSGGADEVIVYLQKVTNAASLLIILFVNCRSHRERFESVQADAEHDKNMKDALGI